MPSSQNEDKGSQLMPNFPSFFYSQDQESNCSTLSQLASCCFYPQAGSMPHAIATNLNINRTAQILCQYIVMFKMNPPLEVTLKNGILRPPLLQLRVTHPPSSTPAVLLRIPEDASPGSSSLTLRRKYIFAVEELDRETEPLQSGDECLLDWFAMCPSGRYKLVCLTYPKLECEVEVFNELANVAAQRKSNTRISLAGLESVEEEKQQDNKEDIGKEQNQELLHPSIQDLNGQSPLGTPKKGELEHYGKILSSERLIKESLENRYLRYFQQQFKIWRQFFDDGQIQGIQNQQTTPVKEKPKSEHRKNSDVVEQNKQENWSKRENYSPNLKFTLSCGSPSNHENLSEYSKQQSQSLLYSQQDNYRIDDQLEKQPKTMKKTNSEYRLNIQDVSEQKDSETETASKTQSKKVEINSFMQWLEAWSQKQEPLSIKNVKDDAGMVKQWLGHLKNKYRISRFLYD